MVSYTVDDKVRTRYFWRVHEEVRGKDKIDRLYVTKGPFEPWVHNFHHREGSRTQDLRTSSYRKTRYMDGSWPFTRSLFEDDKNSVTCQSPDKPSHQSGGAGHIETTSLRNVTGGDFVSVHEILQLHYSLIDITEVKKKKNTKRKSCS